MDIVYMSRIKNMSMVWYFEIIFQKCNDDDDDDEEEEEEEEEEEDNLQHIYNCKQ
jgi:hypothetical protein